MPTLNVVTPFTVSLEPLDAEGKPRDPTLPTTYVFPHPGEYPDVPDEVANHWMTAPHLEGYEAPPRHESAGVVIMQPTPPVEPPVEPPPDTVTGTIGTAPTAPARAPRAPSTAAPTPTGSAA